MSESLEVKLARVEENQKHMLKLLEGYVDEEKRMHKNTFKWLACVTLVVVVQLFNGEVAVAHLISKIIGM
jgi:hypothetical protein